MARTAAQRRRRRANRNPLYNPGRQLSGHRLKSAAKDLAALEFKPAQDALTREAGQIGAQGAALTGRSSDYYLQLAREEQGNLDRLKAINGMIAGQVSKSGEAAQGAITASGEQAAGLAEGSAPGAAGIVADDGVLAETQAARNRAAGNTQDAEINVAGATGAAAGLASAGATARSMQGGETLQRLTNLVAAQQAENRGKQTTLAGQRGAAFKKNVVDMRQQGYENMVTQEGLGIDQAKLDAQVAQAQMDAAQQARQQREVERNNRRRNQRTKDQVATTQRGQDMSAEQRAADRESRESVAGANRQNQRKIVRMRARYGAAKKKDEPADVRKMKAGITNASTDIADMIRSGEIPPGMRSAIKDVAPQLLQRPMNVDTARRVVIALGGQGIVAQAAAELAKYQGVRPGTAAALRRLGMQVPNGWLGSFSGPPSPE